MIGIQGFRITGMSCSFYDAQGNLSPQFQKYLESAPEQVCTSSSLLEIVLEIMIQGLIVDRRYQLQTL
jgi:hypothetical protein